MSQCHLNIESYEKLLYRSNEMHKVKYIKKDRTTCECGKEIYVTQMEKHLLTKLHKDLVRRKEYFLSCIPSTPLSVKHAEAACVEYNVTPLPSSISTSS